MSSSACGDLYTEDLGGPCSIEIVGSGVAPDAPGLTFDGPTMRARPMYPEASILDGVQGSVTFCHTIRPDGTTADLRLLERVWEYNLTVRAGPAPTEAPDGRPLEDAAAEAMENWTYGEPKVGAVPVEVRGNPVRFQFAIDS